MSAHRTTRMVKWRDLISLSPLEKLIENTLCWPWLLISLALAYFESYIVAFPFTAIYFLTALRQSHNGYHNALGISKTGTDITLLINSMFMLASLHAIKLNHVEHHKHNLNEHDYERTVSDMKWWRALLQGPHHWWHNHIHGWKLASHAERKWILVELSSICMLLTIGLVFKQTVILYHVSFMIIAELLMPFFTIWISHHGHNEKTIAHKQRNKWINKLTLNMTLHYEHHLFPAVPAIKLGELTKRIKDAENNDTLPL